MNPLAAVIFDVDGTLVDSERHGHRVAFNLAFEEFGLGYVWDEVPYGELLHTTGGVRRIDHFLAGEGMPEQERACLAPALHQRKTAILNDLVTQGRIELRPGVRRLIDELSGVGVRLAVATTGSRSWVAGLLTHALPDVAFEAVVTGDEVERRKPEPDAFLLALQRLTVDASTAVAVEDSLEGVASATAAGLTTVAVVNDYTAGHDVGAADLVLDGFGDPGHPARVLADRRATGCAGILDFTTLRRLLLPVAAR